MLRFPVNNHVITSPYGPRILQGKEQFHDGVDFISREDNRVFAISDGIVVYDMDDYSDVQRWTNPIHSAGNYLIIQHNIFGQSLYVRYFHLLQNIMSKGDKVECGQFIGKYGDCGFSFGAHLHIDIWDRSWTKNSLGVTPYDPMTFFNAVQK